MSWRWTGAGGEALATGLVSNESLACPPQLTPCEHTPCIPLHTLCTHTLHTTPHLVHTHTAYHSTPCAHTLHTTPPYHWLIYWWYIPHKQHILQELPKLATGTCQSCHIHHQHSTPAAQQLSAPCTHLCSGLTLSSSNSPSRSRPLRSTSSHTSSEVSRERTRDSRSLWLFCIRRS